MLKSDDIARSLDPSVCPFLRRDLHGTLIAPASVPGADQTCIAVGAPRPQPLRQQELVCLRDAHADCPRYLRGAMDTSSPAGRGIPELPKATIAALLILVLSAGLSFAFVVQRGGISMPVVGESPTAIAIVPTPTPDVPAATEAPVPTEVPASVALEPSMTPTPPPSASPRPTPTPLPSPTPAPTASPTSVPASTASPKPTATPTSTRYELLKPCPNRTDCYIYVVRSGDNLFSIANYFGHSLATIYRLNPKYPETRLRVGDPIRMPPPTR